MGMLDVLITMTTKTLTVQVSINRAEVSLQWNILEASLVYGFSIAMTI